MVRWLDGRAQAARFVRARGGATAVEFALVALPFFALIGACLENGIVFWEQEILQQAVSDAGRQIYTGSFQTANTGTTDPATLMSRFRTAICTQSNGTPRVTIFNCANVRVSVTQASSYAAANPVSPVATNASGASDWNASFPSYSCAGASAIVIVQAAVDVPIFFPLLGAATPSLPNRRRVIQAATVFKVEPYTTQSVCS
ncbi:MULTISPECIES: TadE/TadG family type IV pilus assembly protein [Methylobacterium]|uniref:TadE family protein n=2 Tax=Methylobacterium TaxID=407 RepID=A0A089Q0F8_9HYPH|nr:MULTISPECIES: TadE/TadG family type IV pilus assembly protein [Methylobacterium]MBA9064363.1 pilus assembly protein Flp/PilA [Methylobacterium fujisawaense]AIQ88104.1 TadE family protein [Methylobacterium oryzae CBMB20]MBP31456.1 pilus assembly protein [Methylobacterium sp.]MDE4909398.1 pilus assembly protein [Methylobacterium sp. 092160098-2]MDH3027277.1 pilus assembly protein [Methylobacterium fujisawaense]